MTKRNDTETTYPPAPEASPAAAGPPTSPYSDPKTSSIRLYHVWKGNNKFFLGGRLVFGPDARSLFLTTFLIVAPVTLFCIFVSGRLIQEFQYPIGTIILAVCIVFTAYVICLLFLTSATDPGIIPRNTHPPDSEDDSLGRSSEWPGRHAGIPASLPSTKDVMVNGMYVRVKYCHTCMLYRPPRCSHCSICNNCIERFDHHCPWVGQCIGKRNYRFFFMFVSSTTMLCLYVFAFCCININRIMDTRSCNLWAAVAKSPVTGFLLLYTFIATWFVGGLTSFHLYLIFTNQTTYENFRYHYDSETNPYNRGCVRNAIEVFFSCISSSRVNFREKIEAEESPMESSAFPYSVPFGRTFSPEMASKTSFDLEKGKRGTVGEDDLEGLHSHLDSFGRLERCPTQPHTDS